MRRVVFADDFNRFNSLKWITGIVAVHQFESNVAGCGRVQCDALEGRDAIMAGHLNLDSFTGTWSINHESANGRGHIKGSHSR